MKKRIYTYIKILILILLIIISFNLKRPEKTLSPLEILIFVPATEVHEKALISSNIFFTDGTTASTLNIKEVNITIYEIDKGAKLIVDKAGMDMLGIGLWFYNFDARNNNTGTYLSVVQALTNEATPKIWQNIATFSVGNKDYFKSA